MEKKTRWWRSKKKGQKVSFILSIFLFVLFLTAVVLYIYSRDIFGDEIGDLLLGVGVRNGWELIAAQAVAKPIVWVWTLIALVVGFAVIFISNFILHLLSFRGKRRTKTIISLVRSLIKIVVVIAVAASILSIWGVDISSIVTSVGILTLIVGLGCQSLIQDVISGMFIVFDDYFGVGDIVIIDGFRGTVSDFGLKTTKLVDLGGNIKSITNSSINTIVNLSRLDSIITVEMPISYKENLIRVEGVIVGALPDIAKSIPNMTEGPTYRGVAGVKESSVNLLIVCRCKEADRFQVSRDLTRELYLLFNKNHILIPYNQITVNKEDKVPSLKASDIQKMLSIKANNENRGIVIEEKKKETKRQVVKKAVRKTHD